jgi:hypothetical protein
VTILFYIFIFLLGVLVGRTYGWMKYHYPEFQEEIKLRVARKRLERARYEAETEEQVARIDDVLESRISEARKNVKRVKRAMPRPW